MKHMRKVMALVLTALIALVAATPAFAATQTKALDPADSDNGSITITNPAKGETYTIYKVFDATVSADGKKVAYQGEIPSTLSAYFETITGADGTTNYVKLKDGADEKALMTALETWAASATATNSEASDGSEKLAFTGLPYGYYVITTTHKDSTTGKAAISVDSTNPSVNVIDKNTTTPTAEKTVGDTSYSIGDTITYTGTFDTANWLDDAGISKQVKSYTISDTLPEFLSDVKITSITIGGTAWGDAPTSFTDKKIVIPWVDENGNSLYANGAKIVITYTAKLTSTVNVNADNTNTITITPNKDKDGKEPWKETWSDDAKITTYAAALKKTDGTKALAGAKFKVAGLTVEKTSDGVYTVKSYDSTSTELGDEMEVGTDGKLYIVGLKQGVTLKVTETQAPDGYNKLTGTTDVSPQVLETEVFKESGTRYYGADGSLVKEESSSTSSKTVEKNLSELDAAAVEIVNQAGTELPSTGGMGTTILYTIGAILVIGGGVLLVTRRRMNAEQ